MTDEQASYTRELAIKQHVGRGLFVSILIVSMAGLVIVSSSYYLTQFGYSLGSSARVAGVQTVQDINSSLGAKAVLGVSTTNGANSMNVDVASVEKLPGVNGNTVIRLNATVQNKRNVASVIEPSKIFTVLGKTGIEYRAAPVSSVTLATDKVTTVTMDFSVPNIETVNWLKLSDTDTTPRTFAIPY